MSQQQEEPEKDSIEYIRNIQCRAIYERATVCMQQQDTSEDCRRAGDELFVCIGKIKYVFYEAWSQHLSFWKWVQLGIWFDHAYLRILFKQIPFFIQKSRKLSQQIQYTEQY